MKSFKTLTLIFLTGCAVGPNYQTPQTTLPSSYHEPHDKKDVDLLELKEWWTTFNDPILTALIHEAISQNLDLKVAIEKIHQVRSEYKIEAAELYPKLGLNAEQRRTKISQNLFDSHFLGPPHQSLYKIGFDASWEIDLFGKRRRTKEGAYYSYEAEVNRARDVYITLLSEVAATYIEIRGLQEKITLSKRDISTQKKLLELSEARFIAGLDSELSPQEVSISLEEAQALLPSLETSYRKSLHRLAVLLGKMPESLDEEFEKQKGIPISTREIPVGIPSDLLRRRPDIRSAERLLAAATAHIGAAIADLFPRFSLLSYLGFESNQIENWLKARSWTGSFGPSINWPIIHFGRIRANIQAQNAKQQQALLSYEQTILNSLEDVESCLVAYYKEEERVHRYENQVEAAKRRYLLTQNQYLSGLVNFSTVLDADSALIFAEKHLVESQQSLSTNRVALYKSLGGGW